jgi:hypothetical protein
MTTQCIEVTSSNIAEIMTEVINSLDLHVPLRESVDRNSRWDGKVTVQDFVSWQSTSLGIQCYTPLTYGALSVTFVLGKHGGVILEYIVPNAGCWFNKPNANRFHRMLTAAKLAELRTSRVKFSKAFKSKILSLIESIAEWYAIDMTINLSNGRAIVDPAHALTCLVAEIGKVRFNAQLFADSTEKAGLSSNAQRMVELSHELLRLATAHRGIDPAHTVRMSEAYI